MTKKSGGKRKSEERQEHSMHASESATGCRFQSHAKNSGIESQIKCSIMTMKP